MTNMDGKICGGCTCRSGADGTLAFALREHGHDDQQEQLTGAVTEQDGALLIHLDGHGDFCSADGQGTVVVVELANGCPRVLAWADINQEDPTHTIRLEDAREDRRRPC